MPDIGRDIAKGKQRQQACLPTARKRKAAKEGGETDDVGRKRRFREVDKKAELERKLKYFGAVATQVKSRLRSEFARLPSRFQDVTPNYSKGNRTI
jgi:hypothetical protein